MPETAPAAPKPLTFGDLPDRNAFGLDMGSGDPGAEETQPETAAPKPEETPAATPAAPVQQAPPGPSPWEQMAAFEAARNYQAREEQARQNVARQMEQMYRAPTPENPEELLQDPEKMKAHLDNMAAWGANLQRQNQQWTAEAFQQMQATIAQSQAQATANAKFAMSAEQAVGEKLASEGFSPQDIRGVLSEVNQVFMQSPQNYIQNSSNPAAIEEVARFLTIRRGLKPSAQDSARLAANPNMPYSPGARTTTSGSMPAARSAALRAAEMRLGRKIKPETLARFGTSHDRGL